MLATENASRLLGQIRLIAQATDEALHAAEALAVDLAGAGGAAGHTVQVSRGTDWLPGIKRALGRIQLECADLHYSLRELRDALPSPETLQPRLID
jgi:hypothetical protein